MQAGHSFLRKLRLPSPIFSFASQMGLRTPASLSHAPEQQVFRGCLYSFLRKLRLPSPIFNFASQMGLRTLDSLSHAPEQQVFRGCLYYQATAPQERLAVLHKERLAVLLPAMFQQQTQPLTLTFSLPPYTARSAAARFLRRRCRSRSAVCRP